MTADPDPVSQGRWLVSLTQWTAEIRGRATDLVNAGGAEI